MRFRLGGVVYFFLVTNLFLANTHAGPFEFITLFDWLQKKPTVEKTLTDVVIQANKRVRKRVNAGQVVDAGRINLLADMEKEPKQLEADLTRIPDIYVGNKRIDDALLMNKTALEQYELIASLLRTYVKEELPYIRTSLGTRLGRFFTPEVVFTAAQTFCATAQSEAYKKDPLLKTGMWGAVAGNSKSDLAFTFDDRDKAVLMVSRKIEKTIRNIVENQGEKSFITVSSVKFNLETGAVSFHHFYSVNGHGKSWTTETTI